MAIKSIMCCCGAGVGSSLIVRTNAEDALKKLGATGVTCNHTSIDDLDPNEADLYLLAGDLRGVNTGIPAEKVIWISNILDKKEVEAKLAERLGM